MCEYRRQRRGLLDDLSMEAIIAADPQYIFVTIQGNDSDAAMKNVEDLLTSNPAWASLTAVKNDHYYILDKRLFNLKPNAKWERLISSWQIFCTRRRSEKGLV